MSRYRAAQPYIEIARDASVRAPALEEWALDMAGDATPCVQLAVFRQGELAVSIAAGYDARRDRHVTRSSLFNLYSSTKLYQCLAVLHLHDRGLFDWDDPVAKHWPEFAQNGKDGVTIRHVISHRAGMAFEPPGTTWNWWGDRDEVARRMAAMGLKWEPGTKQGYHNRTCGFILDTLAWRWTGRGIGELLREWVLDPLGVGDFHFGIDERTYRERVVLTETLPPGPPRPIPARARDEFRPFIGGEVNLFNSFELLRLPLTWGTAVTNADAAAEVACFFAGKGMHRALRLFSEDVFAQVTTPQSSDGEIDQTFARPSTWGLGPQLRLFPELPGLRDALGHGGGATVQVWSDPAHELAAACILGGLRLAAPGESRLGERARWHDRFAQAVHRDFIGELTE